VSASARSQALVALADDAPVALQEALEGLRDVDVVASAPGNVVVVKGRVTEVRPEVVPLAKAESAQTGRARLWLVDGVLDRQLASRLEDLDIGFVDRAGHWWLPGMPRTATSGPRSVKRRIRGPQIRMAQLLADHPDIGWTQRLLAKRANSTQQTAHRLLNTLAHDGLLVREGAGRSSRRLVRDTPGLWEWLERTCTPGRAGVLPCFVEDPSRLPPIQVPLALTGSHAADAMGLPVISGDRPPVYRARTTRAGLEDVPSMLGGIRTAQGANLLLAADPDDLAFLDGRQSACGVLIAPPSRVMLDLHLEPRGRATAQVFRDLWMRRRAS
jgi:hypothetical protein